MTKVERVLRERVQSGKWVGSVDEDNKPYIIVNGVKVDAVKEAKKYNIKIKKDMEQLENAGLGKTEHTGNILDSRGRDSKE